MVDTNTPIEELLPVLFPQPEYSFNAPLDIESNNHLKFKQAVEQNENYPFKTEQDKAMYEVLSKLSKPDVDRFCKTAQSKNTFLNFTLKSADDMNETIESVPSVKFKPCNLKDHDPNGDFKHYKGSLLFEFCPAWETLKDIFGDPKLNDHLHFKYEEIKKDGKKAFGEAHTCYWWEYVEKNLPEGAEVFFHSRFFCV
eukprot:Lithocolla_globosa_v1_NODE_7377_length_954_cov_6.968854.p1 type:complete len:197 gc:universal NODE_7377_length_954_cov_6.968854:185-775(+)